MEIGGDQECIRKDPGYGAAQAGADKAHCGNKDKACQGPCDHLKHTCQNGKGRETDSLNHEADDIHQLQGKLE